MLDFIDLTDGYYIMIYQFFLTSRCSLFMKWFWQLSQGIQARLSHLCLVFRTSATKQLSVLSRAFSVSASQQSSRECVEFSHQMFGVNLKWVQKLWLSGAIRKHESLWRNCSNLVVTVRTRVKQKHSENHTIRVWMFLTWCPYQWQ